MQLQLNEFNLEKGNRRREETGERRDNRAMHTIRPTLGSSPAPVAGLLTKQTCPVWCEYVTNRSGSGKE